MPRPVTCPHCGEDLDIPVEFRGRDVKCAVCDRVFTTPRDEPPAARRERDWDAVPTSRRAADRDYDRDDYGPRRDFDRWDDRPPPRRRKGGTAWIWAILIGVTVACVLPCGAFTVWAVILAFPDFEPYDSPDGKYRAEFPGKSFNYTNKTEDGLDRTCVEFKRNIPAETYFVHHVDLPAKSAQEGDKVLAEACDKFLARNPGAKEQYRTLSTYDGYPSMDFAAIHSDETTTTIVRFVFAGRRLYAVGITCQQGIEVDEPRAEHFLNAFKVKAADAVK